MSPQEHEDYWLQGHELRTMKHRNRHRRRLREESIEPFDDDDIDDIDIDDEAEDERDGRGRRNFRGDNEDLFLPGLESKAQNRSIGLYSGIYDCDGLDDPFADLCFEAAGAC